MLRFYRKSGGPSPITLGDRALGAGQWEAAARHYRKALARNPGNPPIWVQYGHALKESGNPLAAEAAYRRAIENDPTTADPHLQLGHVLKMEGKLEEAKIAYLRAWSIDRSLNDAAVELAALGCPVDDPKHLNGAFPSELAKPPANQSPPGTGRRRGKASRIARADCARDLGDWGTAARLYREALDRNPQNAPIWMQYGHVLKESGQLQGAENAYRRALGCDPKLVDAYLNLGSVLKLQCKIEEAQAACLRAVALNPSLPFASALGELGWSDPEKAELQEIPGAGRPLPPISGSASRTVPDTPVFPDHSEPTADSALETYGAVTEAEIQCLKQPSFQDEVALFVTHSRHGRLKPHVAHYLRSLKREGIAVVLIIASDQAFTEADCNLFERVDGLFLRENVGYDFAAWAHVLRLHPELFNASILYLINDSLFGPTNESSFGELLTKLRNSSADLLGLTENIERGWHLQSYFLAFKPRALASAVLRQFIGDIVSYKHKNDVVNQYETRLARVLRRAGLVCEPIFPTPGVIDPHLFHWKSLLRSGLPFVKVATLREPRADVDTDGWRDLLAAQGYDISLVEQTLVESTAAEESVRLSCPDDLTQRRISDATQAEQAETRTTAGRAPQGPIGGKVSIITRADRAREAGQWQYAARLYRKALHRNPQNPSIWVQYGHAVKESGSLSEAEAAYRTAITYDPGNADAHLQLGHVLKLQSKIAEAQAAYLIAFALDPLPPYPSKELSELGWSKAQMAALGEMLGSGSAETRDTNAAIISTADIKSRRREKPSIVFPTDWATVYPSSQVLVRGLARGAAMEILVFRLAEFREPDRDPLHRIPLRVIADDMAESRLGSDWSEGKYIFELRVNGTCEDMRGFILRSPGSGGWRQRFSEALSNRHPGWTEPAVVTAPLFSVTTTVYDTPPVFLFELAEDIRGQSYQNFEWLLLDNGSRDPKVISAVEEIASMDPRFSYSRVEENIHIIPGNRYLFNLAKGRFIVPIDSDDRVSSVALVVMAEHLLNANAPDILFSDEAKVSPTGEPVEYMWRPTYSRIRALATCPAAHILTFSRKLALGVGVYSESYAQGSHDWDTIMRLTDAGARVSSVHECLYGWRMHEGSAALDDRTKDYILSSQGAVLENSLARRGLTARFAVEPVIPGEAGYYRVRRKKAEPRPVEVDFVLNDYADVTTVVGNFAFCRYPAVNRLRIIERSEISASDRDVLARAAAAQELPLPQFIRAETNEVLGGLLGSCEHDCVAKLVISGHAVISTLDWIWEVVGTFELDEQVGVIGGAVLDADTDAVLHAGWIFDQKKLATSLGVGQKLSAISRHWGLIRQAVSAVWGGLLAIRPTTITRVGAIGGIDDASGVYGLEYGLRCTRHGITTAFDPSIVVRLRNRAIKLDMQSDLAAVIRDRYSDLLRTDPYADPYDETRESMRPDVDIPASQSECTISRQADYEIGSVPGLKILELLEYSRPLNFRLDHELAYRPTLNLILPVLQMRSMSGGPNTALNLAFRLAAAGIPVRLISCGLPPDPDLGPLRQHILDLTGARDWLPTVEICDGSDRDQPLLVGQRDIFFATAWWTAQMAMRQLPYMAVSRFFYLIQDFEAVLHPASTLQAMALETYDADYIPIVNHPLLHRFFVETGVGRFKDAEFAKRALVFTPAIDRTLFWPADRQKKPDEMRRLLFYARPQTAHRNLFELGALALHVAVMRGIFDEEPWELCGMGDDFAPIELGPGHTLRPLPWTELAGYARQMREADILLSPMLAPHPSYPPLEMAASGGLVVTNTYATKRCERLEALSPNIIAADANINSIARALALAVDRLRRHDRTRDALLDHPSQWSDSLDPVVTALTANWRELVTNAAA